MYFNFALVYKRLFCRVKRVTIELGDLTQHNLKQLKVLNRDVFPVAYNEKFYKDLLGAGELCKLGMLENSIFNI